MTLISCPECDRRVSDMASACPNCGFPVVAGIRHAVDQITEDEKTKSARQQHAAAKLQSWGDRYKNSRQGNPFTSQANTFLDRHWKGFLFVIVTIILIFQLTWVLSMWR